MRKPVGLRTEILLTLSLLMGAALLFGGIMLLRLTEKSLLEQRLVQLDALTATLVTTAENLPQSNITTRLLRGLNSELGHVGWWLYDSKFNIVDSETNGAVKPAPRALLQRIWIGKENFRDLDFPPLIGLFGLVDPSVHYILPVSSRRGTFSLLEIWFSLDDIRHHLLQSQKMVLIYVLLYGVVLILIGYYLLQRNVILPARKLLVATDRVSSGDLEKGLAADGPMEIAQLAEAYNHMIEALRNSREETSEKIVALETANQKLQQTQEELIHSEKLASVGQLAAGLAHELGNPLAALMGYLEILHERTQIESDVDIISRSLVEVQRIDFLIRELLNFSRPAKVSAQLIDPVVELRHVVERLQHQGTLNSVKIIDSLPVSSVEILMNAQKLQQVYTNVLINAVQACDETGVLRLGCELSEEEIAIVIEDSGVGIEIHELPKIFDPFYTTKSPNEGTGLGLAVCQRIVDEANGKIIVKSKRSEGSVFRLVLPRHFSENRADND